MKLVLDWNCLSEFASYKQCYHKVYQSISISLIAFSSLSDINTTLKIGITITWSFTLRYVIATTPLCYWKKISYNDVTSISIRNQSIARFKSNKKMMSQYLQYRQKLLEESLVFWACLVAGSFLIRLKTIAMVFQTYFSRCLLIFFL